MNKCEMCEKFEYGFSSIASYNGYEEWLWETADALEKAEGYLGIQIPTEEWNTDKHALWMTLVAMFGSWGTSIRSGWIEDTKAAAEFINRVTDRYGEWRQYQ